MCNLAFFLFLFNKFYVCVIFYYKFYMFFYYKFILIEKFIKNNKVNYRYCNVKYFDLHLSFNFLQHFSIRLLFYFAIIYIFFIMQLNKKYFFKKIIISLESITQFTSFGKKKKFCISLSLFSIVIKPSPGVDPAKGLGPGFHGSTRVNSGQPGLTWKN